MPLTALSDASATLVAELYALIEAPRLDDSARIRTSEVACSMALEHWDAARALFAGGLLPSGLVVHRAQFEALVRSIWVLYAASDAHTAKLSTVLTPQTEQAAKNAPQLALMMQDLAVKAPPQAYDALAHFKDNAWKALNSYAHAGIHPLRRHEDGYPIALLADVLRNSNGLGVVTCMQAVALRGRQPTQKAILEVASRYAQCMPPAREA